MRVLTRTPGESDRTGGVGMRSSCGGAGAKCLCSLPWSGLAWCRRLDGRDEDWGRLMGEDISKLP